MMPLRCEVTGRHRVFEDEPWSAITARVSSPLYIDVNSGHYWHWDGGGHVRLTSSEERGLLLPFYAWMLAVDDGFQQEQTTEAVDSETRVVRRLETVGRDVFGGRPSFLVKETIVTGKTSDVEEVWMYWVDEAYRVLLQKKVFRNGQVVAEEWMLEMTIGPKLEEFKADVPTER